MSPDVFANNRLSSALDTGKSVKELLARFVLSLLIHDSELRAISPESKHIGTFGLTSYIEHVYEYHQALLQYLGPDVFPQPRRGLQELYLSY